MTAVLFLTIAVAALLGFANGANDNAKGVATLIGSGTLGFRPAIIYAAATTFIGSIAAVFLASALMAAFSGKGIVGDSIVQAAAFPASVGLAAALTVLLATRIAMPISTTHAIIGAMVGVGLAASNLNWTAVLDRFLIPLILAPLIALTLAMVLYIIFRSGRKRLGIGHQTCICIGREHHPVAINTDGSMSIVATGVRLDVDDAAKCSTRYEGRVIGLDAQRVLDWSHLFSAGALSFARGLNDTPKIAAIMLAAGAASGSMRPAVAILAIGVFIAVGGVLMVRRVARTMSHRITGMNDGQAFTANLVTAGLVIFASRLGMPVSTTHVSCGSLFGIGAVNRRAHWKMIGTILLAWVTTLPVAAIIGAVAWLVIA